MFSLSSIYMPGLLTNDHSLNYGIVNLNCYHSFFSNTYCQEPLKTPLDNFSGILLVVTQYCLFSIVPNYYLYCGLKNLQSFLNLFSIWLSFFMPYTHLANPTPIFLQIHGLLMSFLLNLCTENLSNTCSNWCLFLCQNIISHHLCSFPAANWATSLLILSLMTSLSTAHRNCVNFWAGELRLLFKHYIDLKMKVTMLNFDCKNFNV